MLVGRAARARAYLGTAFLLVALALWPTLAIACPPILRSVTVDGNHPTVLWTLPANVSSQFMQTSTSSEVDENGYFPTLVDFNTLARTQTSFTDEFEFGPGVYYLHIAGHDSRCRGGLCPEIEFSSVTSFEVPAGAASATVSSTPSSPAAHMAALNCSEAVPSAPPLPSTSGGPGPDKVAPIESLTFAPVQDVDKLFVRARMSEAGTLTARATVSVPGASKTFRFKTVSRKVRANAFTKLRLKLAKKSLKAVKRALKKRKRLKANVRVTATDKARNKKTQKATIRLRN